MGRPARGETFSITIDDLAFGGEGVGRVDGYVVFVSGGLPGDRLRVRLTETRSRFGRSTIEQIESPSPDRVEAPCPYFGRCGGCRLQHLAYDAQLAFKTKQLKDCLERIGGLGSFELRPILGAPEIYGYRNKMEFTVVGSAGAPVIGATVVADAPDEAMLRGRPASTDGAGRFLLTNLEPGLQDVFVDAGPGLIRKAGAVSPDYGGKIECLNVKNIKRAFFTHLHSDHTAGYPELILIPWIMGRDEPLEVYGPDGIKAMTYHILEAYKEDIRMRLYGLEQANNRGWKVNAHEFKEGIIYKDNNKGNE